MDAATTPPVSVVDSPRRGILRIVVLGIALIVTAERAWAARWMSDDGFIHLRVVDQLLAGNGPVFNEGERVEASTSALWVLLLALGDVVLPIPLEWIAVLFGIALTVLAVGLAMVAAGRLIPGDRGDEVRLPLGAAVYVAVPAGWLYASSGLEGGLVVAWLGGCLLVMAGWSRSGERLRPPAAVLLGIGTLIRPELALFTVAMLLAVLIADWRTDRWAGRLRLVAWALALPVAYQVFRMGYYGVLVPNTAIAKEAGASLWLRGWYYLRDFMNPYALWLPLAALLVGAYAPLLRGMRRAGDRRGLAVVIAFTSTGLVGALYVVKVGGDYLQGRLLLPFLFALVAPVAVVPVRRQHAVALLVLPWAVACTLFLRTEADRGVGSLGNPVTLADYRWTSEHPDQVATAKGSFVHHGVRLPARPIAGRETVHAAYGIGVVGYGLGRDVFVLDVLGLANPLAAHLEIDRPALPGHEKPLPPPWIVATGTEPGSDLQADDFPFPVLMSSALDDPDRAPFDVRVATARATLECPPLRDLIASYTEPLTLRRFIDNVLSAPANTSLRYPPEPEDAAKSLC